LARLRTRPHALSDPLENLNTLVHPILNRARCGIETMSDSGESCAQAAQGSLTFAIWKALLFIYLRRLFDDAPWPYV